MIDGPIAVIGAAGFIGRNVVRTFAQHGGVIAIVRPQDAIPDDFPADVRVVDAADGKALTPAVSDAAGIVHLAARSGGIQLQEASHLDLFEDNRRLSATVLRTAVSTGIRRVFLASSAVVYRDPSATTLSEDDPVVGPADRPNGYAWSKVNDEVTAGWMNRPGETGIVVGRFGNVYGPEASFDPSRSTVVHGLIRRITEAPGDGTVTVWGDGSAERSFIHVADVAAAVHLILSRGAAGGVYNVDTTERITIRDLATKIRDLAAPSVRLEFDPTKPSGPARRVPDNTRLRRLGFTPSTSLEDGLASTIAWYREHHADDV